MDYPKRNYIGVSRLFLAWISQDWGVDGEGTRDGSVPQCLEDWSMGRARLSLGGVPQALKLAEQSSRTAQKPAEPSAWASNYQTCAPVSSGQI